MGVLVFCELRKVITLLYHYRQKIQIEDFLADISKRLVFYRCVSVVSSGSVKMGRYPIVLIFMTGLRGYVLGVVYVGIFVLGSITSLLNDGETNFRIVSCENFSRLWFLRCFMTQKITINDLIAPLLNQVKYSRGTTIDRPNR